MQTDTLEQCALLCSLRVPHALANQERTWILDCLKCLLLIYLPTNGINSIDPGARPAEKETCWRKPATLRGGYKAQEEGVRVSFPLPQGCQGGQGGCRLRRQRGLCSLAPCCHRGGLQQRCTGHFWLTLCLVLALCSVGFVWKETVRGAASDVWKRHGEGVGARKPFSSRAEEIMLVGEEGRVPGHDGEGARQPLS